MEVPSGKFPSLFRDLLPTCDANLGTVLIPPHYYNRIRILTRVGGVVVSETTVECASAAKDPIKNSLFALRTFALKNLSTTA